MTMTIRGAIIMNHRRRRLLHQRRRNDVLVLLVMLMLMGDGQRRPSSASAFSPRTTTITSYHLHWRIRKLTSTTTASGTRIPWALQVRPSSSSNGAPSPTRSIIDNQFDENDKNNNNNKENNNDKENLDTASFVEEPYSLGLKSYRPKVKDDQPHHDSYRLRPRVRFFARNDVDNHQRAAAEDYWVPYSTLLNSDYASEMRRRKQNDMQQQQQQQEQQQNQQQDQSADNPFQNPDNGGASSSSFASGLLQPRVVSFHVEDSNENSLQQQQPQDPQTAFVPWLPTNSSTTLQQPQQTTDTNNADATPFVLPVPFVTNNRDEVSTTPISLAENLLQLGPKMVNDAVVFLPQVVWNATHYWTSSSTTNSTTTGVAKNNNNNNSALPFLWGGDNANSSAFVWNASSASFQNLPLSDNNNSNNNNNKTMTTPNLLKDNILHMDNKALQKMAVNMLEQAESAMMLNYKTSMNASSALHANNNNNNNNNNRSSSANHHRGASSVTRSTQPPPIIASVMTPNKNKKNIKKAPDILKTFPLKQTAKSLLASSYNKPKTAGASKPPKQQQPQNEQSSLSLDWGGRSPTDTLTVQDLDRILKENGWMLQQRQASSADQDSLSDNDSGRQRRRKQLLADGLEGVGKPVSSQQHALKVGQQQKKKRNTNDQDDNEGDASSKQKQAKVGEVAFPQPSVLSYNNLKWGITAASALFFMIGCSAVVPNLWLMGMILGSLYGYEIGKEVPDTLPTAFIPALLVRMGNRITKVSLQIYDFFVGLTFMWKTGVLSYEYWKRYAVLDQKFGIQDKMDAWNARFIEGKENFDKWEKENEVGRKVLATLRTAWLVEERSYQKGLKKRRRQSKYRLIQVCYDVAFSTGKLLGSIIKLLTGGGSTELTEFLKGIRIDISQARIEGIGARVGAVMAALIAMNIIGSLFTLSPFFLGFCAVAVSLIWPTWTTELYERLSRFLQDTRAVGRGENSAPTAIRARNRQDKKRFHYYISKDGSKRYYRTGQPFWPWLAKKEEKKTGFLSGLKRSG